MAPARDVYRTALHLVLAAAVAIAVFTIAPYAVPSAYLYAAGATTTGEVTAMHESIVLRDGGDWRREFQIAYRYRPGDSQQVESETQQIDEPLYTRLQVGSSVPIRYSRSASVRSWLPAAGSVLADSSWTARLRQDSRDALSLFDCLIIGGAALLSSAAYRRQNRALRILAGIGGATVLSTILPFGFIVLPVLCWMWRRSPGKGFGWVLAGSVLLSAVVIALRIPWPPPVVEGPQRVATATVRHQRVAESIWETTSRIPGQPVRQPFQLVDLEFTPEGAVAPIHALDRVDVGSVPVLRDGATVNVVYPISTPRAARVEGGTRTYARQAFLYVLALTYGIAAVLAFVAIPALRLLDRRARALGLTR